MRRARLRFVPLALLFLGMAPAAAVGAGASPPQPAASANSSATEDPLDLASSEADEIFEGTFDASVPSGEAAWNVYYRKRSWEWHLFSTKLIFFLVVGIVAFGMFVAWLQFRDDLRTRRGKKGEEADPAYDVSATLQSVSIKSKTIGAIVLLSSAGFFLMYLIYVYPMIEV